MQVEQAICLWCGCTPRTNRPGSHPSHGRASPSAPQLHTICASHVPSWCSAFTTATFVGCGRVAVLIVVVAYGRRARSITTCIPGLSHSSATPSSRSSGMSAPSSISCMYLFSRASSSRCSTSSAEPTLPARLSAGLSGSGEVGGPSFPLPLGFFPFSAAGLLAFAPPGAGFECPALLGPLPYMAAGIGLPIPRGGKPVVTMEGGCEYLAAFAGGAPSSERVMPSRRSFSSNSLSSSASSESISSSAP
mmetsp:Transcript_43730/g.108820  ORF Transcript_43730/g.108820 Transcript_43730/m.108820 type:complete len:248 (+) Transcript_43730:319-1062(+)